MRGSTQRALNATKNDGHLRISLSTTLAVNNRSSIWALAPDVTRCVSIIRAYFAVSCVAIDHRIHIARRHPPKEVGLAQDLKGLCALPIRLGNDADSKTLRFKHSTNHSHPKTWMIHISVPSDDDDVATVPPQLLHLSARGWQKGSHTKPSGPILLVRSQRLGGSMKKGDVFGCIHDAKPSSVVPSVKFR